jgi:hypothetical protein
VGQATDGASREFLTLAAATTATAAKGALGTDNFGRDRDWTTTMPVTYPDPAWQVKDG